MEISHEFVHHVDDTYKRLSNIRRYNSVFCFYPEHVSSHSWVVAYLTMLFGDIINSHKEFGGVDAELAIRIALLHDIEESMSGDILATMKSESKEFRDELDKINREIIKRIFPDSERYRETWALFDGNSREGKLARLADYMSLCIYSGNEQKMGNSDMVLPFKIGLSKIDELIKSEFPCLSGLVQDLDLYYRRS